MAQATEETKALATENGITFASNISEEKLLEKIASVEEATDLGEAETAVKKAEESPIIVEPKGESKGVEFRVTDGKSGVTKRGTQTVIRN